VGKWGQKEKKERRKERRKGARLNYGNSGDSLLNSFSESAER
jgi:hypothetical protein